MAFRLFSRDRIRLLLVMGRSRAKPLLWHIQELRRGNIRGSLEAADADGIRSGRSRSPEVPGGSSQPAFRRPVLPGTVNPNFRSSPWMREAPQVGFSSAIKQDVIAKLSSDLGSAGTPA